MVLPCRLVLPRNNDEILAINRKKEAEVRALKALPVRGKVKSRRSGSCAEAPDDAVNVPEKQKQRFFLKLVDMQAWTRSCEK